MNDSTGSISSGAMSNSNGSGMSNRDMFLKQVNKNSHKIAKPFRKPLPPPTATPPILDPNPHNSGTQLQSQQPPVYNINKNDFRDVVQKLTGSPAHERFPTPPPPVTHPRPPSSRLQRIRPPPLAQITNRPPQLTQLAPRPPNDVGQRGPAAPQAQPFPPLPPFPSVHPAAESPISAYMRFLQSSASTAAPSPLWNGPAPTGPRPDSLVPQNEFGQRAPFSPLLPAESPVSAYMRFLQSSPLICCFAGRSSATRLRRKPPFVAPQPAAAAFSCCFPPPSSVLPLSPLPFGCAPSPRSPYGMIITSFLFSPTGQFGCRSYHIVADSSCPSPSGR
ncbi:VQ motif-containing protein 9 [Sesamum angolense]|uniref:VQ motif-containing protein 9 n=1 Tax=Sesamum angolense TaxID=2727404 RepID=A0AAE2BJL3_9LAMI|nr:VQ motif-containing protein 9 [Sesamum angolense]